MWRFIFYLVIINMDRRRRKRGINIFGKRRWPKTYQRYKQLRNAKKQGLFILTGICFIVAALVMRLFPYLSRPLDSTEKSIYDEQVPVIWVACNKPNQQVYVTIITDMEGRTDLSFQLLESDMDDVKVWIIINDDYAPFTWSTMKRAAAVQMYTLDQKEFFSEPNDLVYGTGHHAGFRLDFGKNADRMHTIRIEPEDYIMKNREDCWLRVPRIGPWYNRNASKDSIVNLSHDDPEWIGKKMDGEELYFLDMQFSATVHNPAAKNSDLVLKLASPKCKESDSCFDWALSEVFVTQIHYTDEKWQRDMELLDVISTILFGLGLSYIYMVFTDRRKKMEEDR